MIEIPDSNIQDSNIQHSNIRDSNIQDSLRLQHNQRCQPDTGKYGNPHDDCGGGEDSQRGIRVDVGEFGNHPKIRVVGM